MTSQIHILRLVYPPISNQEAECLNSDADAKSQISHQMSQSNLYMVCQRAETFFKNIDYQPHSDFIKFEVVSGGKTIAGHIDLTKLADLKGLNLNADDVRFHAGEKLFKFLKVEEENNVSELVD